MAYKNTYHQPVFIKQQLTITWAFVQKPFLFVGQLRLYFSGAHTIFKSFAF
jgi:hypothetical protein